MRKRLMNVAVKSGVYTIPEQIQYRSTDENIRGEIPEIFGSLAAPITRADFVLESSINRIHFTQSLIFEYLAPVRLEWSSGRRRCSSCENESPQRSQVVVESQQKCVLRSSSSPSPHWCRSSFEESVIAFNLRSRMLIISILSGWEYASALRDS